MLTKITIENFVHQLKNIPRCEAGWPNTFVIVEKWNIPESIRIELKGPNLNNHLEEQFNR